MIKKSFMIFIFDNVRDPLNAVIRISSMKNKNAKKLQEKAKKDLALEKTHEEMQEQTHQLELEKNYESDEKFDESAD